MDSNTAIAEPTLDTDNGAMANGANVAAIAETVKRYMSSGTGVNRGCLPM